MTPLYSLFCFCILFGVAFWISRKDKKSIPIWVLPSVFVLKLLAGAVLYWIYTHYYPKREEADIFKFYDDANILYSLLGKDSSSFFQLLSGIEWNEPALLPYKKAMHCWESVQGYIYNDSRFMVRLNVVLMLFSQKIYFVQFSLFCFISSIGSYLQARFLLLLRPGKIYIVCISAFFIPSVLLWSSGILKEAVLMLALGLFLYYGYLLLYSKRSLQITIAFCTGLLLLIFCKIYLFVCFIPGIIALFWIRKRPVNAIIKFIVIDFLIVILIALSPLLGQKYDLARILIYKRGESIYLAEHMKAGSLIFTNYLDHSFTAVLAEAPMAVYYSFSQPTLSDWHEKPSTLTLLAALENIMILTLIILALYSALRRKGSFASIPLTELYFLLNFILLSAVLIGLTTPLAGSLVRYRIPLQVFIVFICLSELSTNSSNLGPRKLTPQS